MADTDELIDALWGGDIRRVKRLLKQRPERAREADEDGVTPLMHAVSSMERRLPCVRALLDAGADARAVARNNSTILHWAVGAMGDYYPGEPFSRLVEMLVEAGAPLEERQQWGWTPLMAAIIEHRPYEVGPLLEAGADPNVFFPLHSMPLFTRGRSALSQAMSRVENTKLLLAYGADVHACDLNGQTALEVALQVLEESEGEDFKRDVMQSVRVLKKAAAST